MKKKTDPKLALRLVDILREQDVLQDVIYEYGIDSLRVCEHCGILMNEGWMYDGRETFCSDECLLAKHPAEDINDLNIHASDNDSKTYWTTWEEHP